MTETNQLYPKMFTWLFIGILISYITGYVLSTNISLVAQILSVGILPIIIIELAIALIMGLRIMKMKPLTMKICYIIYCFTTGITFSSIFIIYELTSLITIFLATSLIFGVLALYGYKTKKDLSKLGPVLLIGLIISLVVSLLNMIFFHSTITELIITVIGILIFCGYIVYDMKNVQKLLLGIGEEKAAVYGAFQLYLDFINLFIRLIELFGKRKD